MHWITREATPTKVSMVMFCPHVNDITVGNIIGSDTGGAKYTKGIYYIEHSSVVNIKPYHKQTDN